MEETIQKKPARLEDDTKDDDRRGRSSSRRDFLVSGGAAALGSCLLGRSAWANVRDPRTAGAMGDIDATAPGGADLVLEHRRLPIGGRPGRAITINGSFPGPVIRMKQGREALIRVHNRLDEASSIHWHGILLPFDMDGVPGISFAGIPAGQTFTYRYPVRQNGTYWYHSHSGMQEQLGHYGQLIVEPAGRDPVDYDVEHSIVLSDWTFENPHHILRNLKTMEGYYNFQRPTLANLDDQMKASGMGLGGVLRQRLAWDRMRMDPTDIADVTGATYAFLINGRTAAENPTFPARPGERVRLRIVNASSMTFYDVRIPGLPMTVVQADGQNVKPVETDEFRIGVAETYDVVVTMPDEGPYTLFAEAMDRSGYARGTLAAAPGVEAAIPERRRRPMLTMADMGMLHGEMAGSHDAAAGTEHAGMSDHGQHAATPDHSQHAAPPDRSPRAATPDHGQHAGMDHSAHGAGTSGDELPMSDLPDSVEHGGDRHGPGSIAMGHVAYRRLDHPGAGLGEDGWRVLTYGQLRALERPYGRRPPTRQFDLHLTGNMHKYIWGFDGKKWSESEPIRFRYGERLRINMINDTMMSHPIHLHGMWMDLYAGGDLVDNPRKHTVIVQPSELLTVDILADAPGPWAFHCHLLYHMEAGMFRTVAVVRSLAGDPVDADA